MPQTTGCKLCKLHRTTVSTSVCIWGAGPVRTDIMIVGDAPGAEDERDRRPLVGAAGRKLAEALSEAGLTRDDVYVTNAVKCRPPKDRPPEKDELGACFPYLLEEIEAVQPKVIVLLGNTALGALTGEAKDITKRRGKLLALRKGMRVDAKVISTFHPSSCLRPQGLSNYARIVEDLRYAYALANPSQQLGDNVHRFPPGSTDEDIVAALRLLNETEGRVITCDLEWTAGTSRRDMIWPWARRGDVHSIAFSGRTASGDISVAVAWPLSPTVRSVVAKLLENRNLVFHNANADTLWLHHHGFKVNVGGDTMLLAYLIDETQPQDLENVSVKYGGVQPGWKGHLFQQRPSGEAEWQENLTYNASDTQATLSAFFGLVEAVKQSPRKQDIVNLHKHLLLPATYVLMKAGYRGVPIDQAQLGIELGNAELRLQQYAVELADMIHSTPQRAIQLANSADQIKDYMRSLGIDLENAQKNTLKLMQEYPSVVAILKLKEEVKLLSTYLRPWMMLLQRQGDGRLHSTYRVAGARTGRSSAESEEHGGGTIQTAPRKSWVRALVKMPPGRVLVSGDFSTVEMRVAAFYSDCRNMIKIFQDGVDIHTAVAAFIKRQAQGSISMTAFMMVLDQFLADVTKEERQGAKGVNFGLAFGMMEEKLVDYSRNTYGVIMSLEQARVARQSYMTLFPELEQWHQQARNDARRSGQSQRTVFGRVRRFDDQSDVNAAINTPVQSTANDFAYLAMIQVDQLLMQERLDAHVIGYIHDSVMLDCSEGAAPRAKQLLQYVMENVDTSAFGFVFPIPLPAEVKMGDSWAA